MKKQKKGFAMISAVFLLLILGLVGVYIVRLDSLRRSVSNMSIQGGRAYYAAKSGLEWGIATMVAAAPNAACFGSTVINLNQVALNGYTATVTCSALSATEGTTYTVYTITAVGQKGSIGAQDYVSRTIFTQIIQQ
jgi:MSHA biogenesis protein MshP